MPTLVQTWDFVRRCFRGHVDKAGERYEYHCWRVMWALPASATLDELHAALLHDILEDTPTTARDLREAGYSARTIALVEALTRDRTVDYRPYVSAIAKSGDLGLIAIKLADNADNLDPRRLARLHADEAHRLKRHYEAVRRVLLNGQSAELTRRAKSAKTSESKDCARS